MKTNLWISLFCLLLFFNPASAADPPADAGEWVTGVAAALEERNGQAPHPEQLVNELNNRAVKLYQDGKYRKAIELAQQTWAYAEQKLGERHPWSLAALNNLGTLLHIQGQSPLARIRRPGKPGSGPARPS